MRQLLFLFRFIKYRLKAKTRHGIHSPFVFDLLVNTIQNDNHFYAYDPIERLRKLLGQDERVINRVDLGAGYSNGHSKKQSVRNIAHRAAKPAKYGALLFRLANRFGSKNILELGTSLGLSTAYLAFSNTHAKVITLEGCPETAAVAKENFRKLKLTNVEIITGDFKDSLPRLLEKERSFDMVFFDGNHRKEPTLDYFKACLERIHAGSVFIFDDIHWSAEMEEAWQQIKQQSTVTVTIDLFFLGIVFFNPDLTKQDFIINY
jgi:predicted O-methyltransferase YrrM